MYLQQTGSWFVANLLQCSPLRFAETLFSWGEWTVFWFHTKESVICSSEVSKTATLRIFQPFCLYLWIGLLHCSVLSQIPFYCGREKEIYFCKTWVQIKDKARSGQQTGVAIVSCVCLYQWTLFLPLPARCSWLRVTCRVIKRASRGGWRGKSTPHCSTQHLERPSLTTHTRQHQQLMDSSYLSIWWHESSFACPLNIYYTSANQRTMSQELHCTRRKDMKSDQETIGQQYHTNGHHVTWFLLIFFYNA